MDMKAKCYIANRKPLYFITDSQKAGGPWTEGIPKRNEGGKLLMSVF